MTRVPQISEAVCTQPGEGKVDTEVVEEPTDVDLNEKGTDITDRDSDGWQTDESDKASNETSYPRISPIALRSHGILELWKGISPLRRKGRRARYDIISSSLGDHATSHD